MVRGRSHGTRTCLRTNTSWTEFEGTPVARVPWSSAEKVGIAVAPPTDWRNYDTIYTERYMGKPQDNPEGYAASSPIARAKDLKGKLLLAHGTSDGNVHVSNSMQLAYAFENAHIPFDLMVYPRELHHIDDARAHLFGLVGGYVLGNL